jgi:hypothetical protein
MIALDGTDNKGKLGANAILAVSMAVAKVRLAKKWGAEGTAGLQDRLRLMHDAGVMVLWAARRQG